MSSISNPPAQASDEQPPFDEQAALSEQLTTWRAEVARLNDLIAHASGVQASDEPMHALPHLPRAVGYLHTMDNTDGIKTNKPSTAFSYRKANPFGRPGLDYSASFPVTTEALFTAEQMKEYACAALKAQPATTEAEEPAVKLHGTGQGEDSARQECKHTNTRADWDWVECRDCGSIFTGYDENLWGVANKKWFKSVADAKFYKNNGRLPDSAAPQPQEQP